MLNEEQIEKPKKFKYFSKQNVYEQRSPPTQITQWSKKCCNRFLRSVIIKKASQDQQQNQTTITTNINYIQNFVHLKKKLTNKIKIASDKSESKRNNVYSNRKDMGSLNKKSRWQLDNKEQKTAKTKKKLAYIFKNN